MGGGAGAQERGTLATQLPESKTARYESHDRPNVERRLQELCRDCEVFRGAGAASQMDEEIQQALEAY